MGDRSKNDPYADFRPRLVQKALEEKKRMEIDELQKAAYQGSALPATHCYSSDISRIKSGLWSGSEHSWRKLSETSKTNENQKSLHPLSKEFVSFSSFGKTTEELETNICHLQPSRIPSPPFLLDHIENEDEFLYGKCDSSPVYQTEATSISSFPVRQSPDPKKTESGGWSDDDDFLPMQSDCSKTPADFTYGQENVATKDLKISRPTHTWKKYEQTESTNIADVSKNSSRFDIFQDNSPEFLKPKVSCNKELSRTLPPIRKPQNKNDYFGLIPSSDSTSKASIRDIASLLKNLKQIQALRNQNVEPKALLQTQKIDDMADNLAPKPFIPIKNQITLNLKNKTSNSTSGTEMLLTQKDCTSKSQVSEAVRKQSAYDNQNTAAMLVSQFLQKLSTKQGNREICQKAKHVSKTVSNTQTGCSDKNSSQGKAYEKESSPLLKKFGTDYLQESTLSRTRKRSTNSDYPILECSKKSRGTESLAKKHWSQGDTEEQSYEAGKLLKGSLKKESFSIKEGGIRGILKVKAQDMGPEELSFDKTRNEISSDISPARFDKSPREKSHDMRSRRWSRSPRRRSRGRSPRRTSADRSPRRKSLGRSPRKRSRSRKRSADRSPERRSRSCKRRSHDRSPRHKSCGRSARRQSCSRRRQSADRTPEKQPCDGSPHKGPHSDGLRRLPQNNSAALSAGKNPEIKTETNKISKQLQHENNPDLSLCGGESLSSSVHDQKFDKNLEMLKKKKNACDRDSSPQSPMIPSPENIRLGDFLRKKDNENKKPDMKSKHSAMAPCVSKEIKTKCDPVDSAEILALQHEEENSDGKSIALKQFSKKKVVKKSPKVDPTSTDSLSSSLGAVSSSHSVQPELLQLAPTVAPVTSEPYSQYSESSMQNYRAAYQPSAYGEVAHPSTYSYYMNTLPYTSYPGYDTSSYNMYTSQYPMENQLRQSVSYSDYYAETPVAHKQIPVINPTVPQQENHLSKKPLPKKEFRRQVVLVQVDSSTHDTFNKSELKVEKGSKSRIGKRDKGQSNKKEENEGQVEKEKYPGETSRDKNEDRIDTKATGEDRSEKKVKGDYKTEKEDRRYDKSEHKGKESQEDVITPDEERELLSRKVEVQKQMENLNSEYIRTSKLQGEMMRKMRREKDGHKDHIITAYGRLQEEIKVQLADLTSAVKDIDKELGKKVSTIKSSTPRIGGEFFKKSPLVEKIRKGKFLSTMVEVIPENAEFYDPGGHWCQSCNKLVPTVYDMLLHLKSEEHKEHMDCLDKPWFSKSFKKIRNRNEVDINKSYPIKGVQFVMPVDGFYCSLCKLTFPDSFVVEDHIVGKEHNAAYKKLITENPIYERRRILDRLAGAAIIQKEQNKRRLEAEKELANKKKRQEEEISKRKEEDKQTFGKANGKNTDEVDHLVSSKASSESERKNAIKLALLESKKIKCLNRSAGDGKPKQTVVYIGRAPNYKPRTHEHFSSKASRSGAHKNEIKKDILLGKNSLITKPSRYNTNQKEVKADDSYNIDSSPERNLFQNVLEKDQNFKKDLPVEKAQDVVSDQKDVDNSDPYKNLRQNFYKICENTAEAPNSASEQRSPTGHDFDDSRNAGGSFVLVPAVLQNSSVSMGQPADNLKAKEVCSQNTVTADLSTASKTDRLTAPPRSSQKNNAKGKTKITAVQIRGPLTEEETDLLLLGINKDDQLPLAIPKPPPSVISSKSHVALPTEISDTQQDITEAKRMTRDSAENISTSCSSKSDILQQDNPPKPNEYNIYLEELARKAKEYAENSSTQSPLSCYQSLQQGMPYYPYHSYYYYPTTEYIHAEPCVATHLSSVMCSGAVCATSQASNTLSSVVSKIPTIPICPVTQAGGTTAKESQDQSLAYYPSFQITTAKIQGNTLQKSNTTTVQAIVSQKTSITSIESNISSRSGISTVESNILENPQNQNSTVCTQSCSVMQGSISYSPDVSCVKIQTEFGSSLPVTCTLDAQSNLLTSADVEKPCKSALKGQETALYPTVFSSVLSNTCANVGNSLESSQGNIQGSTPPPPVADNCPSKSSDNDDVLYNVSLEPPNMNYANKENVPAVQQGSVIQQEFAPISCNVSIISTSFPPAEQPKSDPDTQTSPVEQENVTQQLVASYSTDIGSNTVTSLSSPEATSVRYSDNYKSSPVPGKISETSANPSNIQNPPSGQGTVLLPLVTSCVSSSVQSNGALENISHPPPVAVQGDAPLFPLPNLSTSSPANLIVPGIVPQPPQSVSYPRQSAPVIQGNVMQQPTMNCNPGIPPLENVTCPPVVRYPPNLRGNSAVLANISHPPPNIRLYHNQSAPNVPGNNPQQSLQRGHCIPAAPGSISQPPPNMNHPQNQLIQLTPRDVSKPPPVIHPGNICVPPVPGTVFHPGNQCGSMILSSVSQPPPNICLPGNPRTSAVLGNILQPPPDISCTGTHPAPPVFGSTSQSPPRMSHCGPGIHGNVSHPPGLQNTVSGHISLRPHFSNDVRVTEPLNVPMQPRRFPPNGHYVMKSQNCAPGPHSKLHADVSLLSNPNPEIKSVSQENMQPTCMAFAPSSHSGNLYSGSSFQQPSIYSTLPSQCIPVSINSVSDSSPNSTTNHISAKIKSSQGEVKSTSSSLAVAESNSSLVVCGRGGRQSRECSDVQNSEQVVSLPNKVHVTSVSVTTSSEEKSVKYQYLSCGTNSFHPAPPGTEPVPILQSSSLCPEKDPSTSQELSEHISEKIESHLEMGVEISVANEVSKTDSVVSFDECVEQCLGVNTSVCSGKLGGNAHDVESKDPCCHPKSQEKCSDLENDTVLGFDCTMSTRSESLDLSPDKAANGTQSVIVTTASTRSYEFSENKNSGFCITSQDVLNGGLLVHGSITNRKVTRLPATSVKNMPGTSQLENVTQENKNCFHTESKELKESTNTAQNNDLVHCGQNFNLHSLPSFKIPHFFQQHGSVSMPAVSSFNEGPSRIVPLPESSLNLAPPGTNSFHESQPSITANNELQKPTPELYINPSSSFPTSTYEKPVQSAEKDTQVTVTKESDAFSSLPPKLFSTEKASTVMNSSVSFLEQVHTKNVEPVKIHVDGTDNTDKVCTAEELINREMRFITENTDKHICISSSSNPFSRRLKCEAQKSDSEVCNVAENYNNCSGNIANQNCEGTKISQNVPDLTQSKGEVIKSKYIMKPENFAKGQNKNSFNVQSGAEDHTQQLPAGSSPCDFVNNNTVFSTQSNTVHNFSPWFQSSSCQMHSSSPHLVSVPSSFHQSFTKHRLTPQISDFLNPPPPGTEPLSDFQIAQNCENPQSTLGHSKGSQGSVSNKFNELVSEKVEMSVASLDISKEFTEESNVSTCASRQSQNDFMKMESPLVSAEDVVRVTPHVNAKSAEAWEMCGHPINIVVKSHPSDQYDEELGFRGTKKESSHATESSEPETQHVNVPSKGDSPGHSRKSETSTSEEQDKTEESALRVPSAESEETFEGMEVSSHC